MTKFNESDIKQIVDAMQQHLEKLNSMSRIVNILSYDIYVCSSCEGCHKTWIITRTQLDYHLKSR